MAMDLNAAKTEIADIIKAQASITWGAPEPDFQDFANVLADGIVQALQHILDNAEDSVGGPIT